MAISGKILVLLVMSISKSALGRPEPYDREEQKMKCGYDSCHPTKENVVNVHLVPHSHDDVGWLKTVDQYYYGSRTGTQRAGVQYILDSVIDELLKDEDRRFIYVETAFFDKWWREQTAERRHEVMHLVHHGRLEFAGGAWSMNDEATTHYHSVLDQFTWGLRILNDTFGPCATPRVAWQIDPFGHSREFSSMIAQSGYDGLFVGRIDHQDKKVRIQDREMEMVLRGSDDIGKASDLLYGVLYNHYSNPPGFCYDILCNDEPLIDDPTSTDNNVNSSVTKFVAFVKEQAKAFRTNHVILTMGEDFHYQDALMNFKNMDKLMKYVNEQEPSLNLIYSTPGCYLKGLHESKVNFPTKQDDFFPYASDDHGYWTGYFTSRPTVKYFERRGNNILQVCKQLNTLVNLEDGIKNDLIDLKEAMGIMQHHDAVTGTEKQHVANDYVKVLERGVQDCLNVTAKAINDLMASAPTKKNSVEGNSTLTMKMCMLNETRCEVTENSKKFIITLYNPLGWEVNHHVRVPVNGKNYEVKDGKGMSLPSEVIPLPKESFSKTAKVMATGELFFRAISIPPIGYKSYFIEETQADEFKMSGGIFEDEDDYVDDDIFDEQNKDDDDLSISNDYLTVKLDKDSGYLSGVDLRTSSGETTSIPLRQEIMYYLGMAGNNTQSDRRASGAYIFRPNGSEPLKFEGKPENSVFKGERVEEIHQKFSDWAKQVIRLYKEERHIEFEWVVGPIPVEDKIGKEAISRFTTDFKSNGVFYTDSNGRQLLKRIKDKRPTWNPTMHEPIAGNYYPVSSIIGIKDDSSKKEMYILTDRVQGGSSLKDGQIELMVHRRLLYDDALGVGEALNETIDGVGLVARGTHYLVFGDEGFGDSPALARSRVSAIETLLQPITLVSPAEGIDFEDWRWKKNEFSGIDENALPPNVHLLTLEPWKDGSVLLRLENFFQKGEYPDGDQATVDLAKLFPHMRILDMRETLLSANQWKSESRKYDWNHSNTMVENFNESYEHGSEKKKSWLQKYIGRMKEFQRFAKGFTAKVDEGFKVALGPMEIRTFVVRLKFV